MPSILLDSICLTIFPAKAALHQLNQILAINCWSNHSGWAIPARFRCAISASLVLSTETSAGRWLNFSAWKTKHRQHVPFPQSKGSKGHGMSFVAKHPAAYLPGDKWFPQTETAAIPCTIFFTIVNLKGSSDVMRASGFSQLSTSSASVSFGPCLKCSSTATLSLASRKHKAPSAPKTRTSASI